MSILTDFFIASADELKTAFPQRYPVAKKAKTSSVKNPFTGQTQTIKEWGPAEPFPKTAKPVAYPTKAELKAVKSLPLFQFKGVDPIKLATLQAIVAGKDYSAYLDDLTIPALVTPGESDSMLYRLPAAFIKSIAGIDKVAPVAKSWATTEEMKMDGWKAKDATEVIEALRKLAQQAVTEKKDLFLWVNL